MFLTILLAPFIFIPPTLSVTLTPSPLTPSENSNVRILWTVQHPNTGLAPDNFTLLLHPPKGAVTPFSVMVNGQLSGSESMNVGTEGSYSLQALFPIGAQEVIGSVSFQVTASTPPPPTSTSFSQSAIVSTSTSSISGGTVSPSSDSATGGRTSGGNSTSPGATNTAVANGSSDTTSIFQTSSNLHSSPTQSQSLEGDAVSQTASLSPSLSPPDSSRPSSSPSESPTSASAFSSSSPKRGTIIGSVLGSIAFFALLAVIIFLLWRRWQKKRRFTTFHADMMVRKPGPTLYELSAGASSGMSPSLERERDMYPGHITPFDETVLDSLSVASDSESVEEEYEQPTRPSTPSTTGAWSRKSNPFRDPELMSRYAESVQSKQPVVDEDSDCFTAFSGFPVPTLMNKVPVNPT